MRRLALLACFLALPALADEPPDYSRQNLLRVFAPHEIELPPRPPGRVQWHIGYFDFRALGMDWRIGYLPIAAPLPGTRLNETAKPPDPFALTNTSIANAPPPIVFDDLSRETRAELRRVRRRTKL
jgi:hypothetical protein